MQHHRLEADRLTAEHRVVFANVLFALREEINSPTESLGAQFRNAASRVSEAVLSLSALLMLLISRPCFPPVDRNPLSARAIRMASVGHSALQGGTPVQIV